LAKGPVPSGGKKGHRKFGDDPTKNPYKEVADVTKGLT